MQRNEGYNEAFNYLPVSHLFPVLLCRTVALGCSGPHEADPREADPREADPREADPRDSRETDRRGAGHESEPQATL